jgi:hypothetical protein
MERYVGLDAHAESCTLGVMGPSGQRLKSMVVETNGLALLEHGPADAPPSSRHARLAVNAAGTVALFIIETHLAQNDRGPCARGRMALEQTRGAMARCEAPLAAQRQCLTSARRA